MHLADCWAVCWAASRVAPMVDCGGVVSGGMGGERGWECVSMRE